jgi:hypothetical protein
MRSGRKKRRSITCRRRGYTDGPKVKEMHNGSGLDPSTVGVCRAYRIADMAGAGGNGRRVSYGFFRTAGVKCVELPLWEGFHARP